MAIKETVESLAAKRGLMLSEVAEEMKDRGYDGEAYSVLTGETEGCYRFTALLRDILDLDEDELRRVHIAMQEDAEEVVDSWSLKAGGFLYLLLNVTVLGAYL